MLSSPYPVPALQAYRAAMVLGWLAGVTAGAWVLIDPPKSYEGLGLMLTTAWGVFLALGSALAALGHALRKYKVELPGLILALGGVVIYGYLSWVQALTDSPGSGPRACLLVLLGCLIFARARTLLHIDREGRRLAAMKEAPE